jgi:hypothetical protein
VIRDLVETRVKKSLELDLRHRPKSVNGQPESDPDNARFSQRRINDTVLPKSLLEAICNPKNSSLLPHILT